MRKVFSRPVASSLSEIMEQFQKLRPTWLKIGLLKSMGMFLRSCSHDRMTPYRLCSNPITLTLKDLTRMFQVVTIPVTLVCAGNRRKEQNMIQKSLGFSWGAAGLSTALFTGVYLADILDLVSPGKTARHVIFEGNDSLPNGPYGTRYDKALGLLAPLNDHSQRLSWARDRRKGMLISWAMNGLP
jgi:nitrate reductase (NAD(P)H)